MLPWSRAGRTSPTCNGSAAPYAKTWKLASSVRPASSQILSKAAAPGKRTGKSLPSMWLVSKTTMASRTVHCGSARRVAHSEEGCGLTSTRLGYRKQNGRGRSDHALSVSSSTAAGAVSSKSRTMPTCSKARTSTLPTIVGRTSRP